METDKATPYRPAVSYPCPTYAVVLAPIQRLVQGDGPTSPGPEDCVFYRC